MKGFRFPDPFARTREFPELGTLWGPTGESARVGVRRREPSAKQWRFALAFLVSLRPDFDKRTREAARAAGYRKPFRNSHRAYRSVGVQEAIRRYRIAFRREAEGKPPDGPPVPRVEASAANSLLERAGHWNGRRWNQGGRG